MRIVLNKHWPVYLDFGRAGSLSLLGSQVVSVLQWITAYVVNSHALPTVPVYKKNRIASLLCIYETTIFTCAIYLFGGPAVICFSAQWSTLKPLKCPIGGSDFSAQMSCAPASDILSKKSL